MNRKFNFDYSWLSTVQYFITISLRVFCARSSIWPKLDRFLTFEHVLRIRQTIWSIIKSVTGYLFARVRITFSPDLPLRSSLSSTRRRVRSVLNIRFPPTGFIPIGVNLAPLRFKCSLDRQCWKNQLFENIIFKPKVYFPCLVSASLSLFHEPRDLRSEKSIELQALFKILILPMMLKFFFW